MWCVVISYSFDMEFHVYDCGDSYEKAKETMDDIYNETVETEQKESVGGLDMYNTFNTDDYARITWNNTYGGFDNDEYMEIRIAKTERR